MTQSDVIPTVTAEASLGSHVDLLTVDVAMIARRMQRGGLSAEQIEAHAIFLADDQPYQEEDHSWQRASYDEDSKLITIYLGGASDLATNVITTGDKWGLSEHTSRIEIVSHAISEVLSKDLMHEVGHAIDSTMRGAKLDQKDQRHHVRYANRGATRRRLEGLALAGMGASVVEAATMQGGSKFTYGLVAGSLAVWGVSSSMAHRMRDRRSQAEQLFDEYETLPSERRAEHFANRYGSTFASPFPLFVRFRVPERIVT